MIHKIEVTQKDIDDSDRVVIFSSTCPVARAVSRALQVPVVYVYPPLDLISLEGIFVKLPAVARTFGEAFDANEEVAPFSFDLEVP